jgi:hypothetical protein
MLNALSIPNKFRKIMPLLAISSTTMALLASRTYAGPLTSSKAAFDAQMTAIEGEGGSGVAAISAPIFALIVLMIIIFTIITLGMAAFEGGGNLPLVERVKNVLIPAAFITVSLGIVGGLVTWIATI